MTIKRVGESRHNALVVHQLTGFRGAEEPDSLIGYSQKGYHNQKDGRRPVGDNLEHPHQGGESEQGNHTLLAESQRVYAIERGWHTPQEECDNKDNGKKNTILHIEFLLPDWFNDGFSHFK